MTTTILTRLAAIVRMGCALCICSAGLWSVARAQTLPSYWERGTDWVVQPAAHAGTTMGNPGLDRAGNPVWAYEYVPGGGAVGSFDPWYKQPSAPLVWDTSWFGQAGAWAVDDDFGTVLFPNSQVHLYSCNVNQCWFSYHPMLRWMNPVSQTFTVDIVGTLRVGWSGQGGVASPAIVDVVIARYDASAGWVTVEEVHVIPKPTPDTSVEFVYLPIDIPGVVIEPGDDLRITHRAKQHSSTQNPWITLVDGLAFIQAPVGTPVCGPAQPNSTGLAARIHGAGSAALADDDLSLVATGIPGTQFGYFLGSRTLAPNPVTPPGASGPLCLGGTIGRFNAPDQVDLGPSCTLQVPLGAMPAPLSSSVAVGETWYFQCWYRDGAATSNFTEALAVTFH